MRHAWCVASSGTPAGRLTFLVALLLLLVAFAFFVAGLGLSVGTGLVRLLFGPVTEPGFADGFFECLLKSVGPHDAVSLIDLHRCFGCCLLIQLVHHANDVVEYG